MRTRSIYVGDPASPRTGATLRFLEGLGDTRLVNVDTLADADLDGVDVVVIDADWDHPLPTGVTLDHLRPPTVLVGRFGAKVAESLHLKLGTNFGCMCLAQDAIAWNADHPVFDGLDADIAITRVPDTFLSFGTYLDVPEEVPALRVLVDDIGQPGQATTGLGFEDSPECEVIAGGFNDKSHLHFAIGRQGRFLHWGFLGSPDDMTPAGRALFENCLRYIANFADDPVREFRTTPPRRILQNQLGYDGWRGVGLPTEMAQAMTNSFLGQLFADEPPREARGSQADRLAWYERNAPFLHHDGHGWSVDADVEAMGLANDDPALLDACLAEGDERAARTWWRYTGRVLNDVDAERAWLHEHRDHLYFTDWGGYRFVSLLDVPSPIAAVATEIPKATATVGAARYGVDVKAMLVVDIPAGFHAYAPGADDGLPLTVVPGDGFELTDPIEVMSQDGHLTGTNPISLTVRGDGDELTVDVRVQLCDSLTCLAPQVLSLRCPIPVAP